VENSESRISRLKDHAGQIIRHVIESINPSNAVSRFIMREGHNLRIGQRMLNLDNFASLYVLSVGKGACAMADPVEDALGDRITGGLISSKYGHSHDMRILPVIEAAHPVPDSQSVMCAEKSRALASRLGERDLLLVLISGGGSAIWCGPVENLLLEHKQQVTSELLSCGATIHEINVVRKHLSCIKGGRLAEAAHPATVISLALSDVIGDDFTSISSGPTVSDPSTFADAVSIIRKYEIENSIPEKAARHLHRGVNGDYCDIPKPVDEMVQHDLQIIVGSNDLARQAATNLGKTLGYNTYVLDSPVTGEAREAAVMLSDIAKTIRTGTGQVEPPALVVAGGETIVRIKGNGKGGRNQEMALAAAIELAGTQNMLFVSFGTDGNDGPTDAAGAYADSNTLSLAAKQNLDASIYLNNNDSYNFFSRIGDLLITGPTGSNVMDIQLLFVI